MGNGQGRGDPAGEGRDLVEKLGGRWTPAGGLCRCPAHADRTPSLSVRPGRTRLLLHCFAGCTATEILQALQRGHLLEDRPAGTSAPVSLAGDDDRRTLARRLWGESRALEGTPAERYLRSRGVHAATPELRFHPRMPHGRRPLVRFRPALVAAVRDQDGLTGIHRTFLDDPDSAGVDRKSGLGPFGRGAVRLGGSSGRLGLAEGVETALSASLLFGVPCWATLGAERFGRIALPPGTREVLLFLDHDGGGRRAEALARAAFGSVLPISVHRPDGPGEDWNDVLRRTRP